MTKMPTYLDTRGIRPPPRGETAVARVIEGSWTACAVATLPVRPAAAFR